MRSAEKGGSSGIQGCVDRPGTQQWVCAVCSLLNQMVEKGGYAMPLWRCAVCRCRRCL